MSIDPVATLSNSSYFKNFNKIIDADGEKYLTLAGKIGILFSVAFLDKEVETGELDFIKWYLNQNLNIDANQTLRLIKLNMHVLNDSSLQKEYQKVFKDFLKETLREKEREELIKLLVAMSSKDDDIEAVEKRFINNLNFELGLKERAYGQALIDESFQLMQKIQKEVENDPSLKGTVKDIDSLQIMTTREYWLSGETK